LLSEDGVIFVSIDDNEVAQLRLLMDEIFGEENFVANFVWQKNFAPKNDNKYISISHEYIIMYSKNKDKFNRNLLPRQEKHNKDYKNPDNDPRGEWTSGSLLATTFSKNGVFEIESPNGKIHLPPKGRCWRFSKEKIQELIKDNRIWFGEDGNNTPRIKRFLSEMPNGIVPQSWLPYTEVGSGQDGTQNTKKIFDNKVVFDFPKPSALIKHFIVISTSINDLILDFFAGSGTTGDAVMQLNAEDGGNRKFILVQLPEPILESKNKTAYDFVKNELKAEPTIFEITKERLIRAAKKIKEEIILPKIQEKENEIIKLSSQLNSTENKEKIQQLKQEIEKLSLQDLGFKIFETKPIWEDYYFDAKEFDASQSLFDTGKLSEEDIQALLFTWKTYDFSPLTEPIKEVDLGGYKAFYCNQKLYLMYKGFTIDHLINLMQKIDEDKNFVPKTIIAYGYHIESARLRELAENLKTHTNKKDIDIDFIIRY
jgi:adenine-specific DNA-methyltransferase